MIARTCGIGQSTSSETDRSPYRKGKHRKTVLCIVDYRSPLVLDICESSTSLHFTSRLLFTRMVYMTN